MLAEIFLTELMELQMLHIGKSHGISLLDVQLQSTSYILTRVHTPEQSPHGLFFSWARNLLFFSSFRTNQKLA